MSATITSVKTTIDGQEYTLTLNSQTGKYEAQIVAPSASSFNMAGGYYPVSVTATYATGTSATVNDQTAGTIGQSCRLVVKEKVKPVITILSPTAGQYITTALGEISFKVLDNTNQENGYSGINLDTLSLNISGNGTNINITDRSAFSATAITGGYSVTYNNTSGLADGTYTITVNVSDNDGNAATATSVSVIIDTAPPELALTSPAQNLSTADPYVDITGTTSDITSAPVTVTVSINGADKGAITVDSEGKFGHRFALTEKGDYVITVTATDKAGKTSSITRNIYYSADIPNIKNVSIVPNPVDGGTTYLICVEVE